MVSCIILGMGKRKNRSVQELFGSWEGTLYIISYPQNSFCCKGESHRCSGNPWMCCSHSVLLAWYESGNLWHTVKIATMLSHTLYSLNSWNDTYNLKWPWTEIQSLHRGYNFIFCEYILTWWLFSVWASWLSLYKLAVCLGRMGGTQRINPKGLISLKTSSPASTWNLFTEYSILQYTIRGQNFKWRPPVAQWLLYYTAFEEGPIWVLSTQSGCSQQTPGPQYLKTLSDLCGHLFSCAHTQKHKYTCKHN